MKRIRGVSLLEIIIAMQLTAMLLALLCRVLPLARRQVRDTDQSLGNAILAQSVLEEYLVVPWEKWPTETFSYEGREVLLSAENWKLDSTMRVVSVCLQVDQVETYRLETLVPAP